MVVILCYVLGCAALAGAMYWLVPPRERTVGWGAIFLATLVVPLVLFVVVLTGLVCLALRGPRPVHIPEGV